MEAISGARHWSDTSNLNCWQVNHLWFFCTMRCRPYLVLVLHVATACSQHRRGQFRLPIALHIPLVRSKLIVKRLSEYGIDSSNLGKISCQEHGPSSWECISQVMWISHELSSHAVLERVLEGLILWTIPIVIVSLVVERRKWRSYCWQQTALSILLHVVHRGAKWLVPTNQWRRISCLFSECRRGRGWPCWLWVSWLICSAPQHVPCTNLPVFSY